MRVTGGDGRWREVMGGGKMAATLNPPRALANCKMRCSFPIRRQKCQPTKYWSFTTLQFKWAHYQIFWNPIEIVNQFSDAIQPWNWPCATFLAGSFDFNNQNLHSFTLKLITSTFLFGFCFCCCCCSCCCCCCCYLYWIFLILYGNRIDFVVDLEVSQQRLKSTGIRTKEKSFSCDLEGLARFQSRSLDDTSCPSTALHLHFRFSVLFSAKYKHFDNVAQLWRMRNRPVTSRISTYKSNQWLTSFNPVSIYFSWLTRYRNPTLDGVAGGSLPRSASFIVCLRFLPLCLSSLLFQSLTKVIFVCCFVGWIFLRSFFLLLLLKWLKTALMCCASLNKRFIREGGKRGRDMCTQWRRAALDGARCRSLAPAAPPATVYSSPIHRATMAIELKLSMG